MLPPRVKTTVDITVFHSLNHREIMVKAIGIDSGTKSFDICGIDDGKLLLDTSIPTVELRDPRIVLDAISAVGTIDLIAAPSGYGLPVSNIDGLGSKELFLMSLVKENDSRTGPLVGLRKLLKLMKERKLRAVTVPGVIHLPTIPEYRKANRIDMGTADKLCTTALAVKRQSERLEIGLEETSFILVEMGYAYTSTLGIENGRIVDAIGGSNGGTSFLSLGAMDSELAYLLGDFHKEVLFRGGARYIAGSGLSPEELFSQRDNDRVRYAYEAFVENIVKSVASIKMVVKEPKEVLLSGRISRIRTIIDDLKNRLSIFGNVMKLDGFAKTAKEAAQGAALIADGIAGGANSDLVKVLKIMEASGTVLDHVYLGNEYDLKKKYGIK